MNRRTSLSRTSLLLALALVLPACGGGSSGGGAPAGPAVVVTLTGGATTSESGGTTTITVALATLPTANVTIQYRSGDTTEGTVDGTGTLTFTNLDGTTAQTITVTGEDDALTDPATAYVIEIDPAVSGDAAYSGLDGTDVNLTNVDNEVVGVSVALTTLGDVVEGGANQTFTVTLGSTPTADVTIPVTVVTGAGDVTVNSPGSGGAATSINLVLNGANLSRTVTVAAVNDGLIEGPEGPYTIVVGDPTSTDLAYDALGDADTADVTGGMVLDNDSATIVVTPTTASAGLTLQTTELGTTDTFQVRLGAPVTGEVTLTITGLATEGTLSTATVVFDNTNGTTFQTVTVTGIDDAVPTADGDVEYNITLTAANTGADPADDAFIGLTATVVVTNFDMFGVTLPTGGTPVTAPTPAPGVPLGGAGTFSTFKLDHPSVITNGVSGNTFEMWFRGRNSGGIKFDGIGRSVSATNPESGWVHNNGAVFSSNGDDWMRRAVGRPSVIRADLDQDGGAITADSYIMFYAGAQGGENYNGIGWVLSNDGQNWFGADTVTPGFAATGVVGDWDEVSVDSPTVILVGTTFHMWYTGRSVAGGAPQIGYATAPLSGGVPGAWTRQNLLLDVALPAGGVNSFDADGVSDPTVVLDGATYRMWFTATDAARNRTTIGYAESLDPADFSAGKFPVPVIVPHTTAAAPWGDENLFAPAAAPRAGGGFHLWYSGTGSGGAGIGYIEMQ